MDFHGYVEIIQAALLLALALVSAYYRTNAKLRGYVADLIASAEKTYYSPKTGKLKLEFVCKYLYGLVPTAFKKIITYKMVESIVQSVFDAMADYAKVIADKAVDKIVEEEPENDWNN